jgi:hypothetical protein
MALFLTIEKSQMNEKTCAFGNGRPKKSVTNVMEK